MKLLQRSFESPAENLACDEALLDWCAETGEEVLRIWESPLPFVVVGYGNHIEDEVDTDACRRRGTPVLRRCSGGGTVLQGPGCLSYAVTLRIPQEGPLTTITGTNRFVMDRNRQAIQQVLGRSVSVTVQGCTDLAVQANNLLGTPREAWIKFSGNAQRRKHGALLFHGTLLYGFDSQLINELLRFPTRQPEYRADRTHADFVANIGVTKEALANALVNAWSAKDEFTTELSGPISALVKEKYGREEWNWSR